MHDIIVVDDGCTDDTLSLLATLDFEVTIISHPHNKGKGAALVSGFRKALELGFDHALTIDADGQHYPEDIPVMLRALDVHPNALIVGSRQFTDENMAGKSKFANRFSNFWFRLQTTISLPDTQTGMRIYPLHRLHGLNVLTSRYEAELELLVFAAWHNVQLVPVPIRVYYPPKEERVSHFRPVRDFTRISILNCFLCLGAVLLGYINMYWRTVLCFGYFGLTMLFVLSPWTLIFFLLHGKTPASRARYHRCVQRIAQHYCRWLSDFHYTIDNPRHIQLGAQPSIIVSNHQSLIDIMLLLSLSPRLVIMVKNGVWRNPIFHIVARYMDCFPLSMDEEEKQTLIQRVTQEGFSILLFPEGTRTLSGEVGRFHRGACYFADTLQLPIQPVWIEGMIDYISKKHFALRPAQVVLHILPPISTGDTSFGADYKRRTKSLELHYQALMHANRKQVAVLGAGVGGLFNAALLTQKGYVVTVFEQLPVFGGGLYSYERDGETWNTGMHILTGVQPNGPVTQVLESLGISLDCVPTTVDHSPASLIGEEEWKQSTGGVYRFVGGSQRLANDLALYITRHGGRIITNERVTSIEHEAYDAIVSTLHPKQLLQIINLPLFRNIAKQRILNTPETFGSFKVYIRLQEETLAYDPVTHFIPKHQLMVMTPCTARNQVYARTIETVMPLDYNELSPWQTNRKEHYAEYVAFKQQKEQEVLDLVETLYPDIRKQIVSLFSSTSLTFRDDFLSPEGAMFGMRESVGSVRTRVKGFYLSGQNVFLHGLCGVVMTARQTVDALCEDLES